MRQADEKPRPDRALTLQSPPPSARQAVGRLEERLRSGVRVCLVEARPPDGPDLSPLVECADRFRDSVDAIQLTDMPFATPHIANLAAGARLAQDGHEVVLNVTCRDRNLIGQQGLLLGAAALGIRNVFCIRGDLPEAGDHPQVRGVFETSGLGLIALARSLRDGSQYRSGRTFSPTPALFVGAAVAPSASYGGGAAELTQQKIEAGADFLVTQPLFDGRTLADYHASVSGMLEGVHWLVGVGAVTTLTALETMRSATETSVPDSFYARSKEATPARRVTLGMEHALRLVDEAIALGTSGVLIYPFDCSLEQTLELTREVRRKLQSPRTR